MLGHIASAHGAPSPTLVLQARALPSDESELRRALTDATEWLAVRGLGAISKIALIAPSDHPLFDLDYRFVQVLSGEPGRFDLRGSCGHSVLSSVVAASRLGWVPRLAPDHRVRVRVLNNGDHVVCEVDESVRDRTTFTAHFVHNPAVRLGHLLPGGHPLTNMTFERGGIQVSEVSAGNPYVFVEAHDLGVDSVEELFSENPSLYEALGAIRRCAAANRGLPVDGAFPKVAAVLPDGEGALAVRALSVPTWHPTIALTGAVCLSAASKISGTIPNRLVGESATPSRPLTIRTRGGTITAAASVSGNHVTDALSWVSVPRKEVTFQGPVAIDALEPHSRKEVLPCLSLT